MKINTQSKTYGTQQKKVPRGKFIALEALFKKQEKSQINNLTLHLKKLENQPQKKHKGSRREEVIKRDQK